MHTRKDVCELEWVVISLRGLIRDIPGRDAVFHRESTCRARLQSLRESRSQAELRSGVTMQSGETTRFAVVCKLTLLYGRQAREIIMKPIYKPQACRTSSRTNFLSLNNSPKVCFSEVQSVLQFPRSHRGAAHSSSQWERFANFPCLFPSRRSCARSSLASTTRREGSN